MTAARPDRDTDANSVRLPLTLTPPQAVSVSGALLTLPAQDRGLAGVVLAPGAGSDAEHWVLSAVAGALAQRGHPVLRFDFAYRAAGRRRPDPPTRLLSTWRDALRLAASRLGSERPLWWGGRSMGGRYASMLAATAPTSCAGLLLLGYPLHPPGRPEKRRTDHWPDLRVPVVFLQGDRDTLCDLDLLAAERADKLAQTPSTVHILRGADHSFGVRVRDGRTRAEILSEVIDVAATAVGGTAPTAPASRTAPSVPTGP